MQWQRCRRLLPARWPPSPCRRQSTPAASSGSLADVPLLRSWDLQQFRDAAFVSAIPYRLPFEQGHLPPAVSKWFIHDSEDAFGPGANAPSSSELHGSFWSEHENTMVPLELTSKPSGDSDHGAVSTFHRSDAPLKLLLADLSATRSPASASHKQEQHSIYLAQCSLSSLPTSLQNDIPTPSLVLRTGKGDVYDSSLWLGRTPTYTPLHRDPNPNFFLQLAGRKIIRLFHPDVGEVIFEHVQAQLRNTSDRVQSSAAFRGEEMMAGPERALLHEAVWVDIGGDLGALTKQYGQQAEVGLGEALFIPKGWWHSVKGVGSGITASANWWFR